MSDIIKNIINNMKTDEQSSIFDNDINVNKTVNGLLNNLDQCDDSVGRFNIKIFGIGGAGCNVVEHMFNTREWPENVSLYALNTDIKALRRIKSMSNRYLMGAKMLNGSGSGGDPKVGKAAVEDNPTDIKEILKLDKGTDLLFIVAGLGKGTGSGASPEIAKIAKELNILTIGIVNFPSVNAEGRQIYENADASFNLLKDQVTSITRISNDKIIQNNKADISFIEAFHKANEDVANTINDIVQMINSASDMNLDFADIRRFFESHKTFMSGNFSLNIEDEYTPEKLKKVIHDSIKASYEEVNINTDDVKILINFKFGKKTPACFINDVRHVFKEETGDNGLSLVHGVEYVDNNIVEASYLMSANDDNVPIKEQEVTTIHKDDEFSIFEEDNISFNKNDTSIIRDENNDTSFGIKQEHIKYDTEELISDHETMWNTNDVGKLITKAVTRSIHKPNDSDKKPS